MGEKYATQQNLRLSKALLDKQGEINALKNENRVIRAAADRLAEAGTKLKQTYNDYSSHVGDIHEWRKKAEIEWNTALKAYREVRE